MDAPRRPELAPWGGLDVALERANRARRAGREAGEVETLLETLFGPSGHLAVYGTLAPGRSNHRHVVLLGGRWLEGFVTGELVPEGWGASLGYPALRWSPDGPRVPAMLLVSDGLPGAWPRLDAFEGDGYRRILVPFLTADGRTRIANLYEGAGEPDRA